MARLIYFFIFAAALCLSSPALHADDSYMGDMGETEDAAEAEVQEAVDEAPPEADEEMEAAEDTAEGQEAPEDTMEAIDEVTSDSAY